MGACRIHVIQLCDVWANGVDDIAFMGNISVSVVAQLEKGVHVVEVAFGEFATVMDNHITLSLNTVPVFVLPWQVLPANVQ